MQPILRMCSTETRITRNSVKTQKKREEISMRGSQNVQTKRLRSYCHLMVSKLKQKSYLSTFCTSKTIGKMNHSEKIPTLIPFTLEEVRPWKLTSWKPMKSMSDIKTYLTLKLSAFLSNMTTFILLSLHQKKVRIQKQYL